MTAYLTRPDRPAIAYKYRPGFGPTIIFLPGYMSDMEGSKALALDAWAARHDHAMLRLDYAGCGVSEGDFEDGTLDHWRDDVLAAIDATTTGAIVLVGSSMGGWLMLLVALAIPDRIKAMVGIAAAPDFTTWGFSDDVVEYLKREGRIAEPSEYSDEPYVTTLGFWLSGQANLLLDKEIPLDCPVRLLQGQLDDTVPVSTALRLSRALRSADVQTILVKDGDHRLSRESDLALLIATVAPLLES